MTEIENLPRPLNRFYLKPRLWMWEAWQYGWDFDDDVVPDHMIGCYFTKDQAMAAIQAIEDEERERLGVWRFFVD